MQLADLSVAPQETEPATGTLPLQYLASPEPWAGWQWGDPVPEPQAAQVWGVIEANDGTIAVGWELDGHRYATVLNGSERQDWEVLDGLFSEGEWIDETQLWNAP